MSAKPISLSRYIIWYMLKVSFVHYPSPLQCAYLLTLVFKHFGVCLDNQIQETRPILVIHPYSLKYIQSFKIGNGD